MRKRAKIKKQKKIAIASRLRLPFLITGFFFMGIWGFHTYVYRVSISLPDAVVSQYAAVDRTVFEPVSIDIPGVAQLSIIEAGKINGVWTISDTQANHVRQSSVPGSDGNIIIYGHNTKKIFGSLKRIPADSVISVISRNGTVHTYQVVFTQVVDPSDTALLAPTQTEALTIYTCTGWLDSKRFVVRAVPI